MAQIGPGVFLLFRRPVQAGGKSSPKPSRKLRELTDQLKDEFGLDKENVTEIIAEALEFGVSLEDVRIKGLADAVKLDKEGFKELINGQDTDDDAVALILILILV